MGYVKYFLSENKPRIDPKRLRTLIKQALIEDIGGGDITTNLIIPKNKKVSAKIIAKEKFLLCGVNIAREVFRTVDPALKFEERIQEAKFVKPKDVIAVISGSAKSILIAERVALNLLTLLCAIATKTHDLVQKVRPYRVKITDTRKTIPGLRELQKYAVKVAGGFNHRMRLDEMFLIKDNHLKIAACRLKEIALPKSKKIEIEAQSLKEFKIALGLKPDVIMLDNMTVRDVKKAVKIRKGSPVLLEASGGINFSNIKKYAATGVDIISVGELTDSVKSVDISLEII